MAEIHDDREEHPPMSLSERIHDKFVKSPEGALLRYHYFDAVAEMWRLNEIWLKDRNNTAIREQLGAAKDKVQKLNEEFCTFKISIVREYAEAAGINFAILSEPPVDITVGDTHYERTVQEGLQRIGPDNAPLVRLDSTKERGTISAFIRIYGNDDSFPVDFFVGGKLQPFFEKQPTFYTIMRIMERGRI
jgi:hypothetical protein